ncbi:T9SS type A sorting domain-containing protein [Rufibacter soli]
MPNFFASFLGRITFAALASLFMAVGAYAQVAPVNPPINGFHIDGGLRANTPTVNVGDWVFGTPLVPGTGGRVFNNDGTILDGLNADLKRDPYNSASDIIFTEGSKFNANPNSWAWTASSAPDKNDINNAMYLVTKGTNNDDWLIVGGDRLSTNGTSYIDIELFQNTVTRNTNNNGFTSLGTDGGRTVNDLVISMEYSNGGGKPNVAIYKWTSIGGKFGYQLIPGSTVISPGVTLNDIAFAETNRTGTENVPFEAFGSTTYKQFAFVEAAINMTKLIGALGDPCLGLSIKTVFIKTKASDSNTAALKDMIEPIQVSISFGSATIAYAGPFCNTGSATVNQTGTGGGTYSYVPKSPTPNGNTLSINSTTGRIDLGASMAGTYTVTYSFNTNGCAKTATTDVTIKASTSHTSYATECTSYTWAQPLGNGNTYTQTGTYTNQTTNADGCTHTETLDLTITGSPLGTNTSMSDCPTTAGGTTAVFDLTTKDATVTGGAAGVTVEGWYTGYNSSTKVFSGLISSPSTYSSGSGTVYAKLAKGTCYGVASNALTVNPSPVKPSVTYNAPACDEVVFSVTVNSPTEGAVYKITDKDGQNAETITAESGKAVIFTGRAAGSGYIVNAKIGNCESDAEVCGVSSLKLAPAEKTLQTEKIRTEEKTVAYPVPFHDKATIEFTAEQSGKYVINLYDMNGELVRQVKAGNAKAGERNVVELDGNDLSDGMYVARILSSSGKKTVKLLKRR